MDEEGFIGFLKKKRKTDRTINSCVQNAKLFENYLKKIRKSMDIATQNDLDDFITSNLDGKNIAKIMWTLQHYFTFTESRELLKHSRQVREKHTSKKRKPFKLRDFRGVNPQSIEKLSKAGIVTVEDLLAAGMTKPQRREISKKTGIELAEILELAKLSDLTRLGAVKSVRARLYHDSGFDTIAKIAGATAQELIDATKEFIECSGFDGIPPLPKEARNAIKTAKNLPAVLEL